MHILLPWLLSFCHPVLGRSEGCHKPPRTAAHVTTHPSKLTGHTSAVSPGKDLNQIPIYSCTQSEFKQFLILKPAPKQTYLILLGYLYSIQKFILLGVQNKYSAANWCALAGTSCVSLQTSQDCSKQGVSVAWRIFSYALSERVLAGSLIPDLLWWRTVCHYVSSTLLSRGVKLPQLNLPLFSHMAILVCQQIGTLLYYTYRYSLTRTPFTDLILPLSSTSVLSPFPALYRTTGIFDYCNEEQRHSFSPVPPFSGLDWQVWEKLQQCTKNMSGTHHSGEEKDTGTDTFFLAKSLICASAPVQWPSPYLTFFVSSMNQLSVKELIKKQNWMTASSATVESILELNWKNMLIMENDIFLGHTALTARGNETSLIHQLTGTQAGETWGITF